MSVEILNKIFLKGAAEIQSGPANNSGYFSIYFHPRTIENSIGEDHLKTRYISINAAAKNTFEPRMNINYSFMFPKSRNKLFLSKFSRHNLLLSPKE